MTRREAYLEDLQRELRRHFIVDPRAMEEARAHLEDAADRARREGAAPDEADERAIGRFGSADQVASAYAADHTRVLYRWLLAVAGLMGAVLAYMDSPPADRFAASRRARRRRRVCPGDLSSPRPSCPLRAGGWTEPS